MLPVQCELCAVAGLWKRGCGRLRVIYTVCDIACVGHRVIWKLEQRISELQQRIWKL